MKRISIILKMIQVDYALTSLPSLTEYIFPVSSTSFPMKMYCERGSKKTTELREKLHFAVI